MKLPGPSFDAQDKPSTSEILWIIAGISVSILFVGAVSRLLLPMEVSLFMVASMGASVIILFAVGSSPMASPWSLIAGQLWSAFAGVSAATWIPDPVVSATLAVVMAAAGMIYLRCLHPPGGATALIAVLGGESVTQLGFQFILMPVAINVVGLFLMHRLIVWLSAGIGRKQEAKLRWQHFPRDKHRALHPNLEDTDIAWAVKRHGGYIDVNLEELQQLFKLAWVRSQQRYYGDKSCDELMRIIDAVEFGTSLQEAWTMMEKLSVSCLPVTDRASRIIGLVSTGDFLTHAQSQAGDTQLERLQVLLLATAGPYSSKPEVVGQIMNKNVVSLHPKDRLFEAVRQMQSNGVDGIPIVENNKLVGMLFSEDLLPGAKGNA